MYTVNLTIHYVSGSRTEQSGSFPLRRRSPEQVAYEFWKQIQKEMSQRAVLEKVIANGDQDITELVREVQRQEEIHAQNLVDDLPF